VAAQRCHSCRVPGAASRSDADRLHHDGPVAIEREAVTLAQDDVASRGRRCQPDDATGHAERDRRAGPGVEAQHVAGAEGVRLDGRHGVPAADAQNPVECADRGGEHASIVARAGDPAQPQSMAM